ncbi:MAG: response regulator [Ktedonobacteraceae bacterium]|nr:response regulator [Ktedonobacteraceae bacterium]
MSKYILVVDDDQEIREIVSFALSRYGFAVETCASGQQVLHWLSTPLSLLPDLIILDIMMPGEDGYTICQSLASNFRTRHIPIIIMTAHTEEIYRRISDDLGAADHITKPFHPLELVEKVITLLQKS